MRHFSKEAKKEFESYGPSLVMCFIPADVNWSICLSAARVGIVVKGTDFSQAGMRSYLSFATCDLLNVWQIVKLLEFPIPLSISWMRIPIGES